MSDSPPGLLVVGAREIATLAGGVRRGSAQGDLALLAADEPAAPAGPAGPALLAYEGRVVAVGRRTEVEARSTELGIGPDRWAVVDARGGTVTPGLIDAHTHLVFGGTRQAELALRQRGHGYLDILSAGGGILQTVRHTRAATEESLLEHGRRWLAEMLSHGVTTVEVKSGYGLDVETELRLLAVTATLGREGPVEVVPTFLGAHAVAPEFRDHPAGADAYLEHVIAEQLPAVVEQGIATSCDVFCERGVFEAPAARRLLRAAQEAGLAARLHADEIHDSGAAALAAEISALSADHLAAVSAEGIAALGQAADTGNPVIATLLPATTFYLLAEHYAPARALIERGVPIALGTDFNPGSSPVANTQLVLSLACMKLGLSAAEALAAMTVNSAAALGLSASHGSLEEGRHADLVVWDVPAHDLIPYWVGAKLVRTVVKRGRVVHDSDGPG